MITVAYAGAAYTLIHRHCAYLTIGISTRAHACASPCRLHAALKRIECLSWHCSHQPGQCSCICARILHGWERIHLRPWCGNRCKLRGGIRDSHYTCICLFADAGSFGNLRPLQWHSRRKCRHLCGNLFAKNCLDWHLWTLLRHGREHGHNLCGASTVV